MRACVLLMLAALAASACMPQQDAADRARHLIFARAFAPISLDPALSMTGNEMPVFAQIYEQLFALSPDSGVDGVTGELAESWQVAADGLSIAVRLRPGIRFADGGTVDADAVRWSLERVKRKGRTPAAALQWLRAVRVDGPLDITLLLHRPYPPALQMLALPAGSVIDPRAVAAHPDGWLAENSAGTGPYRVTAVRGDTVLLGPNPRSRHRIAQFTTVEFRAIPDDGVRRLLLERGDIDMTDIVPAAFVDRYRALDGVAVKSAPGGASVSFLVLNCRRGPLADPRLRRAIAAAIDYRALRDALLKGNAVVPGGYLTPGSPGFAADAPPPARDLALARRLVKEGGYRGEPLALTISLLGPVAEFVQANLADAGIRVVLERRSAGAIQALQAAASFDMIYTGWSFETADALPGLEAMFTRDGLRRGSNASGCTDDALDAMIAEAGRTRALPARAALMRAIDRRLIAMRPVVPLFAANANIAFRADLTGVAPDRYGLGNFAIVGMGRKRAATD